MRAVWSSVESINKQALLQLNDTDLIHQIIWQVEKAWTLTTEDRKSLINYISSRVVLIRDIAES